MSISCDPSSLMQAAACFDKCIPPGQRLALKSYLLCQAVNAPQVVSNWVSRVIANGGAAPSANTIAAATTFYSALVAGGISGMYKTLNMVAPDSDIAARTPLIVGVGKDPYTGGGGGISINGYTAVGASLRSGVNPSTVFSTTNAGWSFYYWVAVGNVPSAAGANAGCRITASNQFFMFQPDNSALLYAWCYDNNNSVSVLTLALPVPSPGYYSLNRLNNTTLQLEHAQSGYAHAIFATRNGADVVTPPNAEFYFCGENVDGVDTVDGARTVSFMAIHDAFTQAQSLVEYNAVQALRTAFGGGFK